MIDSRKISYDILHKVLEEKQFSHLKLQEAFRKNPQLTDRDRAFIEHLVRTCIEHLYEIDAYLNHVSKTPVKKLRPQIRTILRLAACQLLYMDSVPASAACNEAVKLSNKLGFFKLKGFVNGVLRNLQRELEAGYCLDDPSMSLRYSMPEWILDILKEDYPESVIETILTAFQQPVKLSVFANPMKNSPQELSEKLASQGIKSSALPYGLKGLYLEEPGGLEKCESFKNGDFLIQDVSSMLQGLLTAPKKGMTVIDVCAAPGGKSIHAALEMMDEGSVISCDLSSYKTGLIKENARRMQLQHLTAYEKDALLAEEEFFGKADILIADLPCSGLGIIGRKPEIRYNMKKEDTLALAKLQRDILDNVVRYLKPGGRIIYSTCTLTKEEDEENFSYLIEKYHFIPEDLHQYLPFDCETMKAGYLKLIPGLFECDGFFLASARKPLE